ncbi:hypothetical protein EV385_1167 [Krasilnikovia cinnamomea]|uniref:DUF7144 domain-containing protein n=1 Tax=Krasilnikovia cinnamomea TaxID=349313 RepID=A0A4Q7ZFB2_9ACTN|nr:hypothetical protein [Krasilnikovia cinnamomea]RZU49417.1 hypothetical protein EV385_1167 [Krasilnikovia cinnamomea]
MAHVQQTPAHLRNYANPATAWFGWVLFVGIVLVGAGLINVMQGLIALLDENFYLQPASKLVINLSYAVWGWTLLLMGAALVAAGIGVLRGSTWARTVGVIAASVNAFVNIGFVTAYPAWTIFAVTFDFIAIYTLVVHGGEVRAPREQRR